MRSSLPYRRAALSASLATLAAFGLLQAGVGGGNTATGADVWIWLGLLPLHGFGLAAALAMLASQSTGGSLHDMVEMGRPGLPLSRLLSRAACSLGVAWPVVAGLTALTALALNAAGYPLRGAWLAERVLRKESAVFWISLGPAVLLIAPVAEEVLFRLVLFESLRPAGPRPAAWLTAFVFALVHGAPKELPGLFVLSLVLQRCRQQSGNLWLPIMVHAGFNAVSLGVLLFWRFWIAT